ncbi:unnamed protein product [Leptosia nina]|uniref:Uncharacterized protein n=1 Tax=Leptosia nina TaxID=320188 RepID=A0AAV1JJ68_9NEOP
MSGYKRSPRRPPPPPPRRLRALARHWPAAAVVVPFPPHAQRLDFRFQISTVYFAVSVVSARTCRVTGYALLLLYCLKNTVTCQLLFGSVQRDVGNDQCAQCNGLASAGPLAPVEGQFLSMSGGLVHVLSS